MEVRRERREGEQERHSHTKFDKKRQKKKTDHSRRNGQKLHQKKIADPRPAIADQTTKSGRLRRSSKRDKPRELPVLSDAKKPETEPRHTLPLPPSRELASRFLIPFGGGGDISQVGHKPRSHPCFDDERPDHYPNTHVRSHRGTVRYPDWHRVCECPV